MKLTDNEREHYANCLAHGKTITGDEQIKLLGSEQAAWQEVDRLQKELESEQLECNNTLIEAMNKSAECNQLREENERLKSEVRPEVKWFAAQMEQKLKENDHKQHWSCCHIDYLANRLYQEVGELWEAIKLGDEHEIVKESADVANFAMMIADNSEQAKQRIKGEGTE